MNKLRAAAMLAMIAALPTVAHAQTLTAQWDPSSTTDGVTGYQVCVGTASLSCNLALASVGASQTSYRFAPPGGVLVYLAVRAVSAGGVSPYSSEARFSIPGISPMPDRSNPVGTAITPFTLPASDPDGNPLTFVHSGLPIGLTLNQSTGQVSGTPTSVGTYTVVVYASDSLATVSRSFTWAITSGGDASVGGGGSGGGGSSGTPGPSVDSVTPSSGTGLAQTFALRYGDSAGAWNLDEAWAYFTRTYSTGPGPSCLVRYQRASDTIQLMNDARTAWVAGQAGTAGSLGNGQCAVDLAGSSVSGSGTTLTLSLRMRFSTTYEGPLNIYMYASNRSGETTGWQLRGSWVVAATASTSTTTSSSTASTSTSSTTTTTTGSTSTGSTSTGSTSTGSTSTGSTSTGSTSTTSGSTASTDTPSGLSADSVTPASGRGMAETFVLRYSDPAGAWNLDEAWAYFTRTYSTGPGPSCLVRYQRASDTIQLLNDASTAWVAGRAGTAGTLGNGQCTVELAGSSVSGSGTTLSLSLAMRFSEGYEGPLRIYMYASNRGGATTEWQWRGSWIVE